ncbi:hypothetical protein ACJ41O_007682 [Fusarium nematophilum]
MVACAHETLYTDCSPAASAAGFTRPPIEKRLAGVTPSGRRTRDGVLSTHEETMRNKWTFPGPLVLPGDDLAEEPEEDIQSFKSWLALSSRNPITAERRTIYVVKPPEVTSSVAKVMKDWEKPVMPKAAANPGLTKWTSSSPQISDLVDYLGAFYHLMEVKESTAAFKWQPWDEAPPKSRSKQKPKMYLGLEMPAAELVRVRCRPSLDGVARMQVNLDDMLDALLESVPDDAYAIVMLNDFDQYEDEDNDFCAGRAYGGSRIAIVSSFRYNPSLDKTSDVDAEHMWPASHCKTYVDKLCSTNGKQHTRPAKRAKTTPSDEQSPPNTALPAAVHAAKKVPRAKTRDELASYWFSRVAVTASHELGHCFGLGHCVYYACAMQGVNSIRQDTHVPPYLCPVCLSKLSWGLASLTMLVEPPVNQQRCWIKGREAVMGEFCGRWGHVAMFAGLGAWLGKRLEEIKECEDNEEAQRPKAARSEFGDVGMFGHGE